MHDVFNATLVSFAAMFPINPIGHAPMFFGMTTGMSALSRILGLFIMAIGVSLVADGIHNKFAALVR